MNIFYVKATSILPPRTLYPLDSHNTDEPSNPMTSLSLDWPSICCQSQHPFGNLISNGHEYHANGFVFHIPNCCDPTNMFVCLQDSQAISMLSASEIPIYTPTHFC